MIKRDISKEKNILSQLYANQANSVKYLLFFFQNRKELRRFFNQFGGKTLVLPDTFEEFIQICLETDDIPENESMRGIDNQIHERTKTRIIDTYLNLYDNLENAILSECKQERKK